MCLCSPVQLNRERASNSSLRHRELKRSTGRSDDGESVPAPAASRDRCVAVDGILSQPSFGPNLCADCGSGNVSRVRGEKAEGAEELRVVERLVAGLLEQSLRPGLAMRHSQAAGSHSSTRFCEGESNERAISKVRFDCVGPKLYLLRQPLGLATRNPPPDTTVIARLLA